MVFDAKQLANLKKITPNFQKIIEMINFVDKLKYMINFLSFDTSPWVLAEYVQKLLTEKDSIFKDRQ